MTDDRRGALDATRRVIAARILRTVKRDFRLEHVRKHLRGEPESVLVTISQECEPHIKPDRGVPFDVLHGSATICCGVAGDTEAWWWDGGKCISLDPPTGEQQGALEVARRRHETLQ